MSDYVPVLISAPFILAFAVLSLGVAALLRPSRSYDAKLQNYECGAEPIGEAWVQFPVGFYLVALVFLLFPWALTLRGLGLGAFWAMALFLGILSLGWLYAYSEGLLDWK